MDIRDDGVLLQLGHVVDDLLLGHAKKVLPVHANRIGHVETPLGGQLELEIVGLLVDGAFAVGDLDEGDIGVTDPIVLLGSSILIGRLPEDADADVVSALGEDVEGGVLKRLGDFLGGGFGDGIGHGLGLLFCVLGGLGGGVRLGSWVGILGVFRARTGDGKESQGQKGHGKDGREQDAVLHVLHDSGLLFWGDMDIIPYFSVNCNMFLVKWRRNFDGGLGDWGSEFVFIGVFFPPVP